MPRPSLAALALTRARACDAPGLGGEGCADVDPQYSGGVLACAAEGGDWSATCSPTQGAPNEAG